MKFIREHPAIITIPLCILIFICSFWAGWHKSTTIYHKGFMNGFELGQKYPNGSIRMEDGIPCIDAGNTAAPEQIEGP